ncbi:hypothetical protein [Algoriphagus confluentis]|uniref:Uncharacterized protein n=1 Tax=Algoriphagus confluentis TaxID=1697556 RepID=A0ABQ6PRQ9_9BACT|nr:hypothetical protein Aconfl_30660 [Algoriphagus confluentis]
MTSKDLAEKSVNWLLPVTQVEKYGETLVQNPDKLTPKTKNIPMAQALKQRESISYEN